MERGFWEAAQICNGLHPNPASSTELKLLTKRGGWYMKRWWTKRQ